MNNTATISSESASNPEVISDKIRDAVYDSEVAMGVVKMKEDIANKELNLAERVLAAREFLSYSTRHIWAAWPEWQDQLDTELRNLRLIRMALESETKTCMKELSDIRKFFLNPEHEREVARLKDFVETCERLKTLKESGFLDAVADTILKLA